MASYNELLQYWLGNINPDVPFIQSKDGQDAFNNWVTGIMVDLGIGRPEDIPVAELANYEYIGPAIPASGPAEQVIFNAAAPGLLKQVEGDTARQAEAETLATQTGKDFSGLRDTLNLADVTVGPTGQLTSPLLTSQNANVDAATGAEVSAATIAAQAQLAALNTAISQMGTNLHGALGQQAAALKAQLASLQANLGTMTEQQKAALTQQLAQLNAAQGPMSAARLAAAEDLVTSVNIGLEQTKDQLTAEAARDGFVGGSTMQDAALARAVIEAKQAGAGAVGQAKLANAADVRDIATYGANTGYSIADEYARGGRDIGDYGANTGYANTNRGIDQDLALKNSLASGTYDLATSLATQTQDAANRNAAAKLNYGDAAYGNAVNAGQLKVGLGPAEVAAKTALIPYGTAGTNAALGTLGWFGSNVAPPTTTAAITQPSTAGNSIGNLGASLVGGAFRFNDLYKPPGTTPAPKIPKPILTGGGGG